jgi:predicted porin
MKQKKIKHHRHDARRFGLKVSTACSGVLLGLILQSSEVSAQSSAVIYGNLDLAMNKESISGLRMDRGYNNWLGFKGQEDLGEGFATVFNLQTRFKMQSGEQERPSVFWQGETTLGIKSNQLGTVRVGRALTPLWNNIWLFEPWYNSGFNASLASYQTGSYSSDGVTDVALGYANFARISNGAFYDSPVFDGLRFSVSGEVDKKSDPLAQQRNIGMSVNYAKDAIGAMVAYERNAKNDEIFFVGGSYRFDQLTVMGSYSRTNLLDRPDERLGVLSLTYAVGNDLIRFGYGRDLGNGNNKIGLGYNYALSKRTNLYADVYREHTIDLNKTGVAVGMNHTF